MERPKRYISRLTRVAGDRAPIPEALDKLNIADKFTRKGDVLTGTCPIPTHQHGPMPNDQQFKINKRDGPGSGIASVTATAAEM